MSEQTVEVARRWVDAYNRRDIDAVLALSDPDIEFRSIFAGIESGGAFRGYSGVIDYFAAIDDAYERFQLEPYEFLDAGAAVVMVGDASWTGRGSGATAATPIFPVLWMRAARVMRAETFTNRDEALSVAGLTD